ncbi:TM0106 family RecB-like putative nuclease [Arthrobacter sp. H35-D1]|uniref:TM0106 family RecB-like putative nuclease n=1 Tax=Arthrobacter sp. H35-D1 TaxID=3046202 RepID=UPI0024BA74E8|nr:TM0106 family RecB-like putative nuclease [Arthrobacter sp. H35-D1]MDJ0312106.1 TM0106 family RecB-like putative nuclease [Arthrobacter sp. H35-D1]
MFLLDSPAGGEAPLIFSASDLVTASECQYKTLRILDEKLGRMPKPGFAKDEMMERAAKLGDAFEHKILDEYEAKFGVWNKSTGTGVKVVERGKGPLTWASLEAKREETLEALRIGADVVFQATFFDGSLVGFADFLVRQPDGSYSVYDTKLARHAKVSALLQLAAYGDQLQQYGIPLAPVTKLVLGNRKESPHSMADLLPVFRERRDNFLGFTAAHRAQPKPVAWLQEGVSYCGRCDYCAEQVKETGDLLLVNGMTSSQRRKLMADGITTIDALAAMPEAKATGPLTRLRDQARMQLGLEPGVKTVTAGTGPDGHEISYKVLATVSTLPAPSPGDIFFDFEGDPLWQDPDSDTKWGIEYLFGSIEAPAPGAPAGTPETFVPFWAHSRVQEREAFLRFLAYVEARRAHQPDMHVYHYAPYEKSALRNLAILHGDKAAEDTVDHWLRSGLLVDLLDTVRQSVRISESSYSIKKLEPFYMPSGRVGDVTNAGASVVAYADYCKARDAGLAGDAAKAAEAEVILASISAYNEYDCLSTLRLRDWLLEIKAAKMVDSWSEGSGKLPQPEESTPKPSSWEPSEGELKLDAYIAGLQAQNASHKPTNDENAIAMVSAAASYHRREDKQFWWGHFDRLEKGPQSWAEERNMLLVQNVAVLEDWAKATPRARTETRTLKITGTATEGSDFRPGTSWFGMIAAPLPDGLGGDSEDPQLRDGLFNITVEEDVSDPATPELTTLVVKDKSSMKVPAYTQWPMALTPDKPIATKSIREALATLADTVGNNLPHLPQHPGIEILRKAAPRLADGGTLPSAVVHGDGHSVHGDGHSVQEHDYIGAITAAVQKLEHSYLAVQGPPGTGKTHVGSHVIANLMKQGWKVGVVGQSHAVVENMLRAAIEKAGVDPERVGKKLSAPHEVPWKITDDKQFGKLLGSAEGALIGGTAWTMTGASVPAGSLDLLVIDEAGQYSLANTLAVAQSAKRLLLLGDPQQLPQVTQGSHPVPVDESALGWLSAGHATLPEELGYFLADSWRMHPELCGAVSRLSYEGKLKSAPAAQERHLQGKDPGVETVFIQQAAGSDKENKQSSPEEAAEVVRQVKAHVGLLWTPGTGETPRQLGQEDLLVVAAYNAQVHLVRGVLDSAGLSGVRVGTVDKFQGQEAPVVLVTMACADPTGAPRGMEFLLNRNRINVAVSRGQWRAVIIRSPQLTNFMPGKPAGMAELGAFIGLCTGGAGAGKERIVA